ncbi:MAG: HAD-IIA family hydrolase [Desulfosarcinaceae bacterium]|nr:HAD-IIA family hydrolase [Desulfosarcinaceae bacterium]
MPQPSPDAGEVGGDHGRFRDWLDAHPDALDALILDVDGVLLLAKQAIAGSRELLNRLRGSGMPFLLLTNDGDHSPQEKADTLQRCGLNIEAAEIVSCAHGLTVVADEYDCVNACFFVMGNLGTPCYAAAAGLQTTRNLSDLPHCRGVIVGEENYDWEPVINAVVNYFIVHPDALLITPNPDEYYPDGGGGLRLAAGSVARLIERALATYGRKMPPVYLGKPYGPIFRIAHRRIEQTAGRSIEKNRVLMIGDNLDADVTGAKAFGYRAAIVLTGITTPAMLATAHPRPDWVWRGL